MKRALVLIVAALALTACMVPPDGVTDRRLIFNDEFSINGTPGPAWNLRWVEGRDGISPPVQSGESACIDSQLPSVADGVLTLRSIVQQTECGGKVRPYRTSLVTTAGRFSFTSGYLEARIWLDSTPDGTITNWPAWWSNGRNWPTTGELDVMEGLGGKTACHWHGPSGQGNCGYFDKTPGWHTYGAWWHGTCIDSYLDGKRVASYCSSNVIHAPHYLILGLQYGPYGGPLKVPSSMKVDFVRVYSGP